MVVMQYITLKDRERSRRRGGGMVKICKVSCQRIVKDSTTQIPPRGKSNGAKLPGKKEKADSRRLETEKFLTILVPRF